MIYKGSTPVRPYKYLGNCIIKDYFGQQSLDTIPWYSEQRTYKGNTLVYPCFNSSNMNAPKPEHGNECFLINYTEPYKSTLNKYNSTDVSYGVFRNTGLTTWGSKTLEFVRETDFFSFSFDYKGMVSDLNVSSNPYKLYIPISPTEVDIVECLKLPETENVTSVLIKNVNCINHNFNKFIFNFEGTFLLSENYATPSLFQNISCSLYKKDESGMSDSDKATGEGWTSISNESQASILAQYDSMMIIHMSIRSNRVQIEQPVGEFPLIYTFVCPRIKIPETMYVHFQPINMQLSAYMYDSEDNIGS